jgi:hypothetical protein
MNAFDTAVDCWRRSCGGGFEDSLAWHLREGWVHCEPDLFVMAHKGHWDGVMFRREPTLRENAWFVWLAASIGRPLKDFVKAAPWRSDFVLWCRRGDRRTRAVRWGTLTRRVL